MNKQINHMSRQEQANKDFMHNCLAMSKEEQIIDHILAELGEYYGAERVCIYEVNEEYTKISNRNEWCCEGIASRTGSRQNLSLDGLKQWLEWLEKQEEFFLSSSSMSNEFDPEARMMLEFLGADCLLAAPIMRNNEITGFLCVNNPGRNTGDLLLLSVAASLCCREVSSRRRADAKLEKNEREMTDKGSLIQALAIPYANIYTVNADTREAICYRMGQIMTDRYGQQFAIGNYEENIQTYIANDVLEEDRHLFEQVRTVDGVNELLTDNKAFYFNYRVERAGRIEYYQCQLVKPDPKKNEFVIGFKDVNEEKNIELAAQRKVEEALAAVEQVNAVLQEESAISTSLSQEYSSLFKIDARTRKMTLYRTDGIAFDPVLLEKMLSLGDYEVILSKYIDAFVVPEGP